MAKILVLEDDADLAALIAEHLSALEHTVKICRSGADGLQQALRFAYDLLLLDLGLPGLDGLDVCKQYRQDNAMTPILMLTARNTELDRVLGLELGADDYLGKPFSIHELQARVKALLRRQNMFNQQLAHDSGSKLLRFRHLEINPARHEVTCRGAPVHLTAREFDLLYFLASNAGLVYNREQLLNSIWGYTNGNYEHTVNSNINRLRNKIEQVPANPEYILTVRGVGYKFNDALPGPV